MANFLISANTATIGATEVSLPRNANFSSGSPQSTQGPVTVVIDRTAMVAGDAYTLTIYSTVNGGTQRVLEVVTIPPNATLFIFPAVMLTEGWDVTLKLLSGAQKSMRWSVVQDTNDVNAATLAAGAISSTTFAAGAITSTVIASNAIGASQIATDAIDADALKADAVTEIQAGIATAAALALVQADTTAALVRLDVAVSTRSSAATALSSVDFTPARAAKLDNLDAATSTRAAASTAVSNADLTAVRAGKLDQLDQAMSSRAAAATAVSSVDLTTTRIAKLDLVDAAVTTRAPASTAVSTAVLTPARAAALDLVDASVSSRAAASALAAVGDVVVSIALAAADLQGRIPDALDVAGNMKAGVQSLASAAIAAVVDAVFGFALEAGPANATTFGQRLNVLWSVLVGKATYTGLTIPAAITEVFRNAADTVTRAAFSIGTNGVRTLTSADGRP